ncbi:MAG: PEGA domain-containing protein [Planctomycetes bacterium]|nr:PEGA domain-containing protein [Planctomycetota bacterium]
MIRSMGKRADTNGRTVSGRVALSLAASGVLLVSAVGCVSRTVVIRSEPPRARVFVDGTQTGQTPHTQKMTWDSGKVHTVTVSLDEYERQTQQLRYEAAKAAASPWEVNFALARLEHVVDVRVASVPSRAAVKVDGQDVGRAPLTVPIRFDRESSGEPWTVVRVAATLPEYVPCEIALTYAQACEGAVSLPALTRVRNEIPIRILSNIEGATVNVDGDVVGETPLTHKFVFTRPDGASPWTSFRIKVTKDGYRWRRDTESASPGDTSQFMTTLTYEQALAGELNVELEPVRLVWTKLRYYKFDGETVGIGEELVLAQVGEVETEPMVQSVTRMTDRAPDELMDSRLWIAAPEQQLVYSVPFTRPEVTGQLANLWRQVGQGLTRLTDGPVVDMEASVSADGAYAYFSANRLRPDKFNLWRVRMTGQGGFTKITDSPSSVVDTEPMPSPDGSRIVYTSRLRGIKVPQIWTANADGTLPTQLRVGHSPAWSPNGEQILYVASDDDGFRQIWGMNADGSKPTQLTVGPYQHEHPIWTPDGGRIVYASNEAVNPEGLPNFDIWIMAADGTDRTQLTVNGSWDNRPAISPDGKYIYFLSNRGAKKEYENNWQIWRIELK